MINVNVIIVKSRRCQKQETDAVQVMMRSISQKTAETAHQTACDSVVDVAGRGENPGLWASPVMAESLIHSGFAVTSSDFPNNWYATVLDFVGFWPESIHLETGFR